MGGGIFLVAFHDAVRAIAHTAFRLDIETQLQTSLIWCGVRAFL